MPAEGKHSNIGTSPDFRPYREDYTKVDGAGPFTDPDDGVNAAEYDTVVANIGVEAGGNATLALYWWSKLLGKFVPDSTPVTWTVVGGTGVSVVFNSYGRRFMLAVSANAAGRKVNIEVAGFWLDLRSD